LLFDDKVRDKTRNETSKDGQPTLLRRQGEHLSVSATISGLIPKHVYNSYCSKLSFFSFFLNCNVFEPCCFVSWPEKNNNYMIFSPKFCNYWQ